MKTILAFVLLCFALVTSASAVGETDEFKAVNTSGSGLPTISINYASEGGTSLLVPSNGTYTTAITDAVASITINGTTIPNGTGAVLSLPGGSVQITWTNLREIMVIGF